MAAKAHHSPASHPTTEQVLNQSLFALLRERVGGDLTLVRCPKDTIVHLTHTLEDLVVAEQLPALLFTSFPDSDPWRGELERYHTLAQTAEQVYLFTRQPLPPEPRANMCHVTLPDSGSGSEEWFMVLLAPHFAVLLCGQGVAEGVTGSAWRFEMLWSFEADPIERALHVLEQVMGTYRPDRLAGLHHALHQLPRAPLDARLMTIVSNAMIVFEETVQARLEATAQQLDAQLHWREDLTATLVHDLRTPLQSMVLALDMLQPTQGEIPDLSATAELWSFAARGAGSLLRLVQLLLDTNKLEARQFAIQWQPIDLPQLITDVVQQLDPLVQASQLAVVVNIRSAVATVWGDYVLLLRVLQNLVGNAVKFTPPQRALRIEVLPAPASDAVLLRVVDKGDGIAPEALPRIFDRYFQAGQGDGRGSGFGLYFCRLAIEAQGGRIGAESQLGAGTAITLVLRTSPPDNA